jgi:hypothetical protein
VRFGPPVRFMQTQIVVLPLSPHGELRALHERIVTSGLPFERSRFPFSPHCTLSFYPTLTPERERALLSLRIAEPVVVDRLQFFSTVHPQAPRRILELRLSGTLDASPAVEIAPRNDAPPGGGIAGDTMGDDGVTDDPMSDDAMAEDTVADGVRER